MQSVSQSNPNNIEDVLLEHNKLNYEVIPVSSLVVKRGLYKYDFDITTSTGAGSRSVCHLKNGEMYVNGKQSFLTFTVQIGCDSIAASRMCGLGSGSACNFLEEVLASSGGYDLSRIPHYNNYIHKLHRHTKPLSWFSSPQALAMGYEGPAAVYSGDNKAGNGLQVPFLDNYTFIAAVDATTSNTRTFCIPLDSVCPVFNSDKLLPSYLVNGLRLEILWAAINTAFYSIATVNNVSSALTPTSYTISDLRCVLDCYQLTDSTLATLARISSTDSLEVYYNDAVNNNLNLNSASLSIDAKDVISRGLTAFCTLRDNTEITALASDSMLCFDSEVTAAANNGELDCKVSNYHAHLGGIYLPQQAFDTPEEMFYNQFYAFGNVERGEGGYAYLGALRKRGIGGGVTYSLTPRAHCWSRSLICPAALLERSNVVSLSGLALNGSRVLEFKINLSAAVNMLVDLYVQHVKHVKCYLNNVQVFQ